MTKTCRRCGSEGPFNLEKRSKDGLTTSCKKCLREYGAKYREDHSEELRAYQKDWKAKNPDLPKEYARANYARNKEQARADRRAYYAQNKDQMNARVRENYRPSWKSAIISMEDREILYRDYHEAIGADAALERFMFLAQRYKRRAVLRETRFCADCSSVLTRGPNGRDYCQNFCDVLVEESA